MPTVCSAPFFLFDCFHVPTISMLLNSIPFFTLLLCRGKVPTPRAEHSAVIWGDKYLAIFGGGSHSHCFNDLNLLDLETVILQPRDCASISTFTTPDQYHWHQEKKCLSKSFLGYEFENTWETTREPLYFE